MRSSPRPALLSAALLVLAAQALVACGPPQCKPSAVKLPAAADTLNWTDDGYASVQVHSGNATGVFVLDTGFSQTSVGQDFAKATNPNALELDLGATHVGPMIVGILDFQGIDGVLGAETLHQIPMRFDARARTTDFLPAFEAPEDGAAPLTVIAPDTCRNNDAVNGPSGPFALLVQADLEGTPGTFVIDTGATASFVRTGMLNALSADGRPTLSNIRIASGFDGSFVASATRAKTLTVGNGSSPNQLILGAPEVDQELDQIGQILTQGKQAGIAGTIKVDGFLGWTFLREFAVSFAGGTNATTGRVLSLQRFDTQGHWQREFQGIGIYRTAPSADEPPGIKIDGFLSSSPAKDAGMLEGDIIDKVNGVLVGADDAIVYSGPTAKFEVQRNVGTVSAASWTTKTFVVPWKDLLPDPQ